MNTSSTQDSLAEVWAIKDALSASQGHSLAATCRALYAEQQKHPGDFVNLGATLRLKAARGDGIAPVAPPTPPGVLLGTGQLSRQVMGR